MFLWCNILKIILNSLCISKKIIEVINKDKLKFYYLNISGKTNDLNTNSNIITYIINVFQIVDLLLNG